METDTRGRVLNVHYTMAPSNRVVGLMTSTYNHLGAGLYTLPRNAVAAVVYSTENVSFIP